MAKLYELAQQYADLYASFESGELSDAECGDLLRRLDDDIQSKILGCARVFKNLKSDYDGVKKERNRLQERERALANQIDGIKAYMMVNMELVGAAGFKDAVIKVSLCNTGGSVDVHDETAIPAEYLTPQPPTVNRAAILELLKAGGEVPGCALKIGTSLRIS